MESKYLFETIGPKRKGGVPAACWSAKPIWLRLVTIHNIHYVLFHRCFFRFSAWQTGSKKYTWGEVCFFGGQSPRKIFGTKTSAKKCEKCFYHAKKRNAFNRTIARSHEIVQQEVGWVVFGVKFESICTVFCKLKSRRNPRIALRASVRLVETFLVFHGEITTISRKVALQLRRSL